jgi:hypothetical protein
MKLNTRAPTHKTRKVQLNSHLYDLLFIHTDVAVPAEKIREMFQTPDLDALYPAKPEVEA